MMCNVDTINKNSEQLSLAEYDYLPHKILKQLFAYVILAVQSVSNNLTMNCTGIFFAIFICSQIVPVLSQNISNCDKDLLKAVLNTLTAGDGLSHATV